MPDNALELVTVITDHDAEDLECAHCHAHIRGAETVWTCGERDGDATVIYCVRSCAEAGPASLEDYNHWRK